MALIDCKKCGRPYSQIKDSCPFCGAPQKEPEEVKTPKKSRPKKEIAILPPDERKSPMVAALFVFFFWWLAIDTFYLKGLLRGLVKLFLIYILFPVIWVISMRYLYDYLLNWPELSEFILKFNSILAGLILYAVFMASFGPFYAVCKAIYYIALPIGKFNQKYNSCVILSDEI